MQPIAVINVRKEPYYRREAIETGLKKLGYKLAHPSALPMDHGDLLVLWNRKRGQEDDAATRWELNGGTVIVMENGYLQKVDKSMYAISVGQHNGAGWFPVGTEDRFTSLGFEVKPWQDNPDGHWLVCGQRGIGSPLMASPPQWAEKTAAKLKKLGLPVRLRPHPGNFAAKVPLVDDLKGCRTCVIWSSGSGVRAIVEGIPVQQSAPYWICEGAGTFGAPEEYRQHALHRMSHGQWTVAEIASGGPFARMRDANWGWGRTC